MAGADGRVDALYGLPLERFVAARDALAKTLRAEDDRARAQEVRRLAKPTRAAWAVNMVIREHPEAARTLAESARLLASAQQELLAGGDPSLLREASDRARRAVDALIAAAPAAAGDATADRVRATLHAATVDPDVLAEVSAGRVVRERVASGFGGLGALTAAATTRAVSSRKRVGKGGRSATTHARRATPGSPNPVKRTSGEQGRRDEPRPASEQQQRSAAREHARRLEKLRRAKEAEAHAEHDLDAARRALEQVESTLADRRAQVRAADARFREARRRRQRAEP